MKAQILKIAGVKSEKEFYKKYPSEAAFMKVHGKEFKKAQMGTYIGGDSMKAPKPINYQDYYDNVDKQLTGTTEQERLDMAAKQASIAAASKPSGGGFDISSMMSMFGGEGGGEGAGGMMSMLGGAKYGTRIPKAQFGNDIEGPLSSTPGFVEGMGMDSVNGYGVDNSGNATNSYSAPNKPFDFAKGASLLGPVGGAINAFGEQRKQKNAAKQSMLLSGLSLDLSRMRPEQTERKYVTPWDNPVQPEQMFPTYGVGTNVLTGRNGVRLQSGGEIQNTYAPNNLYDDLGYEPLNNSNVKQYQVGGAVAGNMAGNFVGSQFNNNAGYQAGSAIGGFSDFIVPGSSAFVSPILGAIGGGLDQAFGDAGKISKYQQNTKRNIDNTVMNNMAPSIQASYSSNLKNGGYMNPEYNPQVITMFGDHTAADFADYAHKDQYRAGGHLKSYTPPSERAMETFAMGGQLETHWGGEAETMSYNPYMPGSGETVVFRGQSHNDSDGKGNTGIGITYGENPVEVERGEPMFEMQSGGELNPMTGEPENTGVVFGNMEINKKIASQFNDDELMAIADKYHGKKFKNVGIDLAKQEVRQNKIIDKSTDELDNLQVNTSFDKLKLSALKANLEGANLKLKDIANTKISLANYQNAINDTKEEMSDYLGNNISAEHLAKGLIKIDKDPVTKDAKWGGDIAKKAKDGVTTTKETTAIPKKTKEQLKAEGYVLGSDGKYRLKKKGVKKPDTETKSAKAMDTIPIQKVDKTTGLGEITPEQFEAFKKKNDWYTDWANFDPKNQNDVDKYAKAFNAEAEKRGSKARIMSDEIDPKTKKPIPGGKTKYVGKQFISAELAGDKKVEEAPEEELIAEEAVPDAIPAAKSRFPWEIPVNMAIDYLRPTDQSGLDYNQLMGEMYAMSNNQVEPVQAQLYNPELGVPYDISLQDQLNANQADFNATQRLFANNPFALAQLNAQKYAANEKVLGEQFRANQAMKDKVYGDNRNILNQAKLTNLGILDKQYERQSAALSNTKATTQAALNSMSDKYAKNKLENRKLSVYENMYNYRFGKSGRAQNYNGLQLFDTQASAGKGGDDIPEGYKVTGYDANRNPRLARITEKDMKEDEAALEAVGGIKDKNGGKHKKNYKNSSVVKAYKNL